MRISDWSSDVCSSDLCLACRMAIDRQKAVAFTCRSNCVPVGAFLRCSGGQRRGPPRLLVANHGVEYAQQVTHAGGHGYLAGFAVGLEARIERLEGRVVSRSEERRVGKECVSTCRFRWSPYN